MKTKLVYVLTCAPEQTYIEQAVMAVWSARYWNPGAYIVLLTDDKTSAILHEGGPRGEILLYVSDEIVTPFETDKSMHYRSRWLKTKSRELVSGDMVLVDCDTICCKPLESLDAFTCLVGAVPDSHLPISEYNEPLQRDLEEIVNIIGWSIKNEEYYFSSGVVYLKDMLEVHNLFRIWHETWERGLKNNIYADQPSFAYANIQCGHIVERIPDSYNHILFTQIPGSKNAHILHISAYGNPSILFETKTLEYIKDNGLKDSRLRDLVLNPCKSFRPYDYDILHSSFSERWQWVIDIAHLDNSYLSALIWMIHKRIHVLRHRERIKDNIVKK